MDTPRYTEILDWFEIDEVSPRIYRVRERHYRASRRCNIYLIKGMMQDLLVDSGLGVGSLRDTLRRYTAAPLLVLTNSHCNHMGGAYEFRERAIHEEEAAIIASPTRENTYADELLTTADFARLPWQRFSADHWTPTPAPATRVLREGDIIDLGDRSFEVLSTPGHSRGSICLWDSRQRLLISGDSVYEGEISDHLPCSDVPAYIRTMDWLRVLPVDLTLPGHGPPLSGYNFRSIATRYVAAHYAGAAGV